MVKHKYVQVQARKLPPIAFQKVVSIHGTCGTPWYANQTVCPGCGSHG